MIHFVLLLPIWDLFLKPVCVSSLIGQRRCFWVVCRQALLVVLCSGLTWGLASHICV